MLGCILLASCREAPEYTIVSARPEVVSLRTIAVTVDDLPFVGPHLRCDARGIRELTTKLTRTLSHHGVPAVGFVNESKICAELRPQLMPEILGRWVESGFELGNHTYNHRAFDADPSGTSNPSFEEYRREVLDGERITREVLESHGASPRYFRHPYLRSGPNDDRKAQFIEFLGANGYEVAPVTIDNSDWQFASAYSAALQKEDTTATSEIAGAYLDHMAEMIEFYETLSVDIFGRPVAQILLIHANELNADYFGDLATYLEERAYRFVTLEEALQDDAYDRGDVYTGPRGYSWLQRWWFDETGSIRPEPAVVVPN